MRPFYIVTPAYSRYSAGIKVLHQLCHQLNRIGAPTYLIIYGNEADSNRLDVTKADLLTPLLTQHVAREHYDCGIAPIFIYSDIVIGNPYAAQSVVRYLLNFPGFLGGDATFSATDLIFSYSSSIGLHTSYPNNILFIPISNPDIFYPPQSGLKRTETCYFANKFKNIHSCKIFDIPQGSIEIVADDLNSQSVDEIADIFRRSKFFYTFENTSLALDAGLCGCPTVFMPNNYLQEIIADNELGRNGLAWGNADDELVKATNTVGHVRDNYTRAIKAVPASIERFLNTVNEHFPVEKYDKYSYQTLLPHLLPAGDLRNSRQIMGSGHQTYAQHFSKLPWWVEREIGSLLCKLGLRNDGEFLWNRGTRRSKKVNANSK